METIAQKENFFAWYIKLMSKIAFVFLGFLLFLRRSWVGEDAFIFFRYVDNFVNGHGLVFNVGERVEGFTSPLWVFVLSSIRSLTHFELRPTAIILGLFLSIISLVLFINLSEDKSVFFPLVAILLITNSAFRDFATSGFETSLTYVLLITFVYTFKKDFLQTKPLVIGLILSLLVLNRPESFLLLAYCGLLLVIDCIKYRRFKNLLLFSIPVVLLVGGYQIFRMGYYASLLPNTFYAKKGGDFYLQQGYFYIRDFVLSYPLTTFIFIGLTLQTLFVTSLRKKTLHLFIMALLLLSYVLYAGGDYMHGRSLLMFFVLWASSLIDSADYLFKKYAKYNVMLYALLIFIGLVAARQVPITSIKRVQINNINDERTHFGYDFEMSQFSKYIKGKITSEFGWAERGYYYRDVAEAVGMPISVVNWNIGYFGYASGDKVNVMGAVLTDPYIARKSVSKRGKIGHENGPEWEYVLSRKPTFSYTPFKYWNESAHFKMESSKFAYAIRDDSNDSFVPVFDLSNREFIIKFSKIVGRDIYTEIDSAQVAYLNTLNVKNGDEGTSKYLNFLKIYWYPYASTSAQKIYDSTVALIKKYNSTTFDNNLFGVKDEYFIYNIPISGTMNLSKFMHNIRISTKGVQNGDK